MKIINAKVYTIEEITQEDLNNLALERNTLVQENEELKSQLRGTTHCFDEEEHNRLKEENKELKLQNTDLRADIMIQKQAIPNKLIKDKSFYDLYDMPTYEDLLTQQKKFIKYLKDMLDNENDIFSVIRVKDVLNKYKEIIGDKE